jgi:IS5 family transposase
MIREIYKLGYRQTEGFLESLIKKLNWKVNVPDYSVINRRRKKLKIKLKERSKGKKYIVVDSTGAKVYGEGEWKVRQHGWSKHRTWRKIHLAVDESTGQIESCATTTNGIDDAAMVKPLLDEIDGVKKLAGDGAYDKKKVYEELDRRKIKPIIPPCKRARIEKHGNSLGKEKPRDKNIRAIRKFGRKKWKKKIGYHRRSIAETTMYRFKNTFGDKLTSRIMIQQETEVKIKCLALNKMATLGLPITTKI